MIQVERPTGKRQPKQQPASNTANWKGYAEELDVLEAELEATQTAKKDIYKAVRDLHGRVTADALKTAMRLRRMKAEKRQHHEEVDAVVFDILTAIGDSQPSRRRARPPELRDGAAAARVAHNSKVEGASPSPASSPVQHDPETGEITDTDGTASDGEGPHSEAAPNTPTGGVTKEVPDATAAITKGDTDAKSSLHSVIDSNLIVGAGHEPDKGRDTRVPQKANGVTSPGGEKPGPTTAELDASLANIPPNLDRRPKPGAAA